VSKLNKPKILVILGPTATGKSNLAVKIAKEFNGEIISADSRQVYKGLDIGTGKITKKEMRGIPHHLLDIMNPKQNFTIVKFQKLAEEKIDKILEKEKLPIIVGGTGFYIESIVDGLVLPNVPPDKKLRKELEKKSVEELLKILEKISPDIIGLIKQTDKRRLIRRIEIAKTLGKIPKIKKLPKYNSLQIGLELNNDELKKRIKKRLTERIDEGMIDEARKLHKKRLSFKSMINLGLEYKYLAFFLQNKISENEMIQKLEIAIWQFAKRQRTWFKRDKRIKWFQPKQTKEIREEIKNYLFLVS